jgi:hypothetical protein
MGNKLTGFNFWRKSKKTSKETLPEGNTEKKGASDVDFRQEGFDEVLIRKRKFILTARDGFLLIDTHGEMKNYSVVWGDDRVENANFIPFSSTVLVVNTSPKELMRLDIERQVAFSKRQVTLDKGISRMVVDNGWVYGIMERQLFRMETNLTSKPEKSDRYLVGSVVDDPVPVRGKIGVLRKCQGQENMEGYRTTITNRSYLTLFDETLENHEDLDLGLRSCSPDIPEKYYSKLRRLDDSHLLVASNAHDFCVVNVNTKVMRFFNLESCVWGEICDVEAFEKVVVLVTWHTKHYHVTAFTLESDKMGKGVQIVATHTVPRLFLLNGERLVVLDTSAFSLWHLDFPEGKAKSLLAVPLQLGSLIVNNFPLSQREEAEETEEFTDELGSYVTQVPRVLLQVITKFI